MSKRKGLPPVTRMMEPLMGFTLEGYTVGDWCPTPDGSGRPEAVALSLRVRAEGLLDGADMVMRLRTPEAVDKLIQSLLRHKRSVWPDAP